MKMTKRIFATALAALMLTSAVAAEKFTPSVSQKPAPEIVVQQNEKKDEAAAIIRNEEKKEIVSVPVGDLLVTPVSKATEQTMEQLPVPTTPEGHVDLDQTVELKDEDLEIKEGDSEELAISKNLLKATKQVQKTEELSELVADLDEILKGHQENYAVTEDETGKVVAPAKPVEEIKSENLIVKDIFDVSITAEYKEQLAVEGHSITIRLKTGLSADIPVMGMHNYEGDKWEMIDHEHTVRHDNGDISLTLDSLSPVALVVDKTMLNAPSTVTPTEPATEAPTEAATEAPTETPTAASTEAPVEPDAEESGSSMWLWIVIGAAVAVVVVVLVTKNKKKDKEAV